MYYETESFSLVKLSIGSPVGVAMATYRTCNMDIFQAVTLFCCKPAYNAFNIIYFKCFLCCTLKLEELMNLNI